MGEEREVTSERKNRANFETFEASSVIFFSEIYSDEGSIQFPEDENGERGDLSCGFVHKI